MADEQTNKPPLWAEPAKEYREIAKDCVAMRRPDLAIGFLTLAEQAEHHKGALAAVFGVSPLD